MRRGVGWDGILPGTDGRVAVQPGVYHIDLSDDSTGDKLFGFLIDERADILATNLEQATALVLRGDYGGAFIDRMHHGLFAIDVFSGL